MISIEFSDLAPKERIIRVAAVLFAERGYHAVGVSDLCKAAGLSRGALYHHVHSKEEILYEICCSYMTELGIIAQRIIQQERDPTIQLQALGYDLVNIIASHKAELTVCFREIHSLTGERRKKVLQLHATYEQIWADVLKAGAETGQFRPYSKVCLKSLLGMYYYSYIWIQPNDASMIDEATSTFHDIALKAVLPISASPTFKGATHKS